MPVPHDLFRVVTHEHVDDVSGADATTALGQFDMKAWIANIAGAIRAVKSDQMSPRLQKEFFEGSRQPATKR